MGNNARLESIGVSNLVSVVERCNVLTSGRDVYLNGQSICHLRFSADHNEFSASWYCDGRMDEVRAPLFDDPDPMLFWGEWTFILRCWSESRGTYKDWAFAWA